MEMRRVLRSVSTLAIGALLFGVIAVVSAPSAAAAVSCSGTISYDHTINRAGQPIGELTIYYNSSNGGTNSACFYHRGVSNGVAAPTYVRAFRCTERSGEGQPCTIAASSSADSGNYKVYAGPRGVTGTANYCVAAEGYIVWAGTEYYISSGRQGC
jgi:hypothetical protein